MKGHKLSWIVLGGIGGFFLLKYVVLGTCEWSQVFGSEQPVDASNRFFYPLLGLIQTSACDQVSTTIDYSGSAVPPA
jgi:hypothetical protein